MSNLKNLVYTIEAIESTFDIDFLDLQLLTAAQSEWDADRDVRITDLVRKFSIASPATIHYRIAKDLQKKKMIVLRPNPADMREKLVTKGPKFRALMKFLGEKQ